MKMPFIRSKKSDSHCIFESDNIVTDALLYGKCAVYKQTTEHYGKFIIQNFHHKYNVERYKYDSKEIQFWTKIFSNFNKK